MSLLTTISQNPAITSAVLTGALLGPAAAATSAAVPQRRWPWQPRRAAWLIGVPATLRRRLLLSLCAAVVLGSLALVIGARPSLLAFLGMGIVGVTLAAIDLEHHRLPDRLILPAAATSVLALLVDAVLLGTWSSLREALACSAVVGALFLLMALISPSGMGLGDVKLAALLGLLCGWLGWQVAVLAVLAGFLIGALGALLLLAARRATLRSPIPFGPALLMGAWLVVLASGEFA